MNESLDAIVEQLLELLEVIKPPGRPLEIVQS